MKIKFAVFLLTLLGIGGSAFAQGVRISSTVTNQGTIGTSTNVVVLPVNPAVALCAHPANAVPCTNKVTTFTSATLATPCSTSTQIVLDGSTACVASPDAQNNFGFWVAPSATGYDYTITLPGGTNLGPFYVPIQTTLHNQTETFTGTASFTQSITAPNINYKTPFDFGAKGNVVTLGPSTLDMRSIAGTFVSGANCSIASGQAILTCTGASFTSADAGKAIVVNFAGSVSGTGCSTGPACALVTTILSQQSATQVTLTANATTTVSSNGIVYYFTDDTAAVRSCIYNGTMAGGRCTIGSWFGISNAASAINFSGAPAIFPGGMVDGAGGLLFAPQGVLTAGTNDRLFYLISLEFTATGATMSQIAAGAIAKGATSFTAQNASDAAVLSPGDWIEITERDNNSNVEVDNKYIDWYQVLSVASTTVNIVGNFRMAFPNAVTWTTACGPCSVSNPIGLGFRRVRSLMQNITLRDFNIIIPKVISTNLAAGLALRSTRGAHITGIQCVSAAQACIATSQDQGMTVTDNHIYVTGTAGQTANEFGSVVDAAITNNEFGQPGGGILGAATAPLNSGLLLDFGTGFSRVTGNYIGSSVNSGIGTLGGMHDTAIVGNHIGYVIGNPGGSGISVSGGYRNSIIANTFAGGTAATTGVTLGNTSLFTVNINSDSNIAWGNVSNGFGAGNYSCTASNATDVCSDLVVGPVNLGGPQQNTGFLNLTFSSANYNGLSMKDTAGPHTITFGPCFGVAALSICDAGGGRFVDMFYAGHTWQFGGGIMPATAGGADVGATANPWGNLWLGTAGTNNFKFQPATTTGARIITIADPLSPTTVGLPLTIASGTSAMTTALIATVACGTTVTTAATGVLTTDVIDFSFNAAVTAANNGLLITKAWATAGNVNFNYCNPTAGGVTPTAMTVNWSVRRP